MTGYSQNTAHSMFWLDLYSESSQSLTLDGWRRLVEDKLPWTEELQLKKPWFDPITGEEVAHWVLAVSASSVNLMLYTTFQSFQERRVYGIGQAP
jgi:hypothetical protein